MKRRAFLTSLMAAPLIIPATKLELTNTALVHCKTHFMDPIAAFFVDKGWLKEVPLSHNIIVTELGASEGDLRQCDSNGFSIGRFESGWHQAALEKPLRTYRAPPL